MPVNGDKRQRIVELVAKIEAEEEQVSFAALVHELSDLLDAKPHATEQPPPPGKGQRRGAQAA